MGHRSRAKGNHLQPGSAAFRIAAFNCPRPDRTSQANPKSLFVCDHDSKIVSYRELNFPNRNLCSNELKFFGFAILVARYVLGSSKPSAEPQLPGDHPCLQSILQKHSRAKRLDRCPGLGDYGCAGSDSHLSGCSAFLPRYSASRHLRINPGLHLADGGWHSGAT